MILGLTPTSPANCFVELDDAIRALQHETGDKRTIALNAHAFESEIPADATAYNLEIVGVQVQADAFRERRVWDFSLSNIEKWRAAGRDATHVPIGYHPSMERFTRAAEPDIDVVFTGCLNERRIKVLQALADRDLNVVVIKPGVYGAERDAVLSRAKLALNMLFYEDGVFPALRVAHLVANRVPVLSERCREGWDWVPTVDYEQLVDVAERRARSQVSAEGRITASSYELFRSMPMVLP